MCAAHVERSMDKKQSGSRHSSVELAMERRYLSLKEVSIYLGLKEKTLYLWSEEGRIPAYKVGRVWRFDRGEVDRFVKSKGNAP